MTKRVTRKFDQLIYPRKPDMLQDRRNVIQQFVIGPYAPPTPPLSNDMTVACIGSCFAQEMAKHLESQGKRVAPIFLSERWNTAYAIRHFIENALEGTPFPEDYLGGLEVDALATSFEGFGAADAFIVTFGLSVCWHNLETHRMVLDVRGGYRSKSVLTALAHYAMRQTSVAENIAQIEAAIACIRRHKPSAPIVLTLSPIPLLLAATKDPVVPANTVSKAVLRAALHEVCSIPREDVYYWPSYEIVEWFSLHYGPVWGQGGDDLRHLAAYVPDEIMQAFSECYFADVAPPVAPAAEV